MTNASPKKSISDVRAQVLETALNLFTTQGYFKTSVHTIQKSSGVSIGSIYHHFKNKEDIAKALYQEHEDRLSRAILGILQAHDSAHDRCRAVVEYLLDLAETSPQSMEYMLHARHSEFIQGLKPVCSSVPFEMITGMVLSGIDSGEIVASDPTVATVTIFGGALRLIHLKLDGVLTKPLGAYLDEVWLNSWHGVTHALKK